MVMGFKEESTFDKRVQLSNRMREQYPDKIPVIVEAHKEKNALEMRGTRFLIGESESVHKLIFEARKKMDNIRPEEALFFFCKSAKGGEVLAPSSSTMGQLYDKYKDDDGLLYFIVTREQVYG
jgi:GABA(A) receptor-associated protein